MFKLLSGKRTEEIVRPEGLLKQLTKALLERAMGAELTHHLGYERVNHPGRGSGNNRNGQSRKKVQGDFGTIEVATPRDRNGSFEPKILPKHERRFAGGGFDQKILSAGSGGAPGPACSGYSHFPKRSERRFTPPMSSSR